MITFTARSRETIVRIHTDIADALDQNDAAIADALLVQLADYTETLAQSVFARRDQAKADR
jgi:hypothetical protein